MPHCSFRSRSGILMGVFTRIMAAMWPVFGCPLEAGCQWVLTAIHPDPTPSLGAPTAEFIALVAMGSTDSCIASDNWSLRWNDNIRPLPVGCWNTGTVLVAHRASDSLSFQLGNAESVPIASWPALLNGGGTVVLTSPDGEVHDAMPYTEESLGGGGRPLLRASPYDCGAASNQRLWHAGMSPFLNFTSSSGTMLNATSEGVSKAREPGRVVPRGAGTCDWYLGSTFDPVSMLTAKAWVGGRQAELVWKSDSVVSLTWDERFLGFEAVGDTIPVILGPLRACPAGARKRMLSSGFIRFPGQGGVEATGVLCDPVPGDPSATQQESFELVNVGTVEVDLSSWDFDGAHLTRQRVLEPGSRTTLRQDEFEDWPGMPNGGGSLSFASATGQVLVETSWSPCDHDAPALVGTGMALTRDALPGSDWHTAGAVEYGEARDDPQWTGFGCQKDINGLPIAVDVHFNRYIEHLPGLEWSLEGGQNEVVHADRVGDMERSWRITWEGMGDDILWPGEVNLSVRGPGFDTGVLRLQCPAIPPEAEAPCLRIVEAMWNASDSGSEFIELQNCGMQPLDLMGLQATVEENPFPSDWRSWRSPDESLVLLPGSVAAFGRCPKWMGNGLPHRGPSRWEANEWSALNDSEGMLSIRLPLHGLSPLDSVVWHPDFEGPWWWSSDGWSWIREASGDRNWTPSVDRGSPGRAQGFHWVGDCQEAVDISPSGNGAFPRLYWQFPESGGTIEVRSVGWPAGILLERWVLEGVEIEGSVGLAAPNLASHLGQVLLEVRWWSPSCRGRRVLRLPPGAHG